MIDALHTINGIRIVESHLATTRHSVRVHRQRRNQTARYHRRIQKKWDKRFGVKNEPGAYMIDGSTLGLGFGKVMVVHPTVLWRLKAHVEAEERAKPRDPFAEERAKPRDPFGLYPYQEEFLAKVKSGRQFGLALINAPFA